MSIILEILKNGAETIDDSLLDAFEDKVNSNIKYFESQIEHHKELLEIIQDRIKQKLINSKDDNF